MIAFMQQSHSVSIFKTDKNIFLGLLSKTIKYH